MNVLSIKKYGNPVLRKISEEVKEINDDIRSLINEMFEILGANGGIGLAAPQIGVLKRIICVSLKEINSGRLALINPVIEYCSNEKDIMEEGCLSIPQIFGDVERSLNIVVKGYTGTGRAVEITANKLFARVIQHETDHLNGTLFIDRMAFKDRKKISKDLDKIQNIYKIK